MKERKIRYGIVGVGKQGSFYAKNFKLGFDKNAVVTAVCDILEERRTWALQNLKEVSVFENYTEMFKSGLIDVVMVVTPHYFHAKIAIDALKAGLNVIIDKPAGVYTKAIAELNEEAKKHPNLLFGIMYNQRTNSLYVKAKSIIDSGGLGELTRINWLITSWYRPQAYYDQGGWRGTWAGEGGGVLTNQCPHQLDLFTWLAGLPIKVKAYTKTVARNINVENDVTAYCEFANGASGVFITSTHDSPGTNRLEICGTGGQIIIENEQLIYNKNNILEPEFSKINKEFMKCPPKTVRKFKKSKLEFFRENVKPGQHFRIIRNFSEKLLNLTDRLIAPGSDGIVGLTFSNAIHLSGWLGKEVLLPFDENLFFQELQKRIAEEKIVSKK